MLSGSRSSDWLQSLITPDYTLREIEDAELMQESLTAASLGNEQQAFVVGARRWKVKEDCWLSHTVNILKNLRSVTGSFLWSTGSLSGLSKVSRKRHILLFGPCWAACGILVPWPVIKPMPCDVEAKSLNHRNTRKVPKTHILERFWGWQNLSVKHHFP